MPGAAASSFAHVGDIRTTPQRLRQALTEPAFIRQYCLGMGLQTDRQPGAAWRLVFPDGRVADRGEIAEIDAAAPGAAVAPRTVAGAETMARAESGLIDKVSGGGPRVVSDLKSLLETGESALAG